MTDQVEPVSGERAGSGDATATPERVLWTESVAKSFGGFRALKDVSVSVGKGEVLGIIGPNGAGKTTLFNIIAGMFRPTAGHVFLLGTDITRMPPHRRLRLGIARTFQLVRPFVSMSIQENLITAAMASGVSRRVARERVDRALEELKLTRIADKPAGDINSVEGKRLEVARSVVSEPKVILLDEIFTGLNSEEVEELVSVVNHLRDTQTSVLIIEHNVRAIKAVAHRIVAIDAGAIVSQGTPSHVLSDPKVIESYLGEHTHA
jgi:branched-chain amino acid transport system ATP-binding protein